MTPAKLLVKRGRRITVRKKIDLPFFLLVRIRMITVGGNPNKTTV